MCWVVETPTGEMPVAFVPVLKPDDRPDCFAVVQPLPILNHAPLGGADCNQTIGLLLLILCAVKRRFVDWLSIKQKLGDELSMNALANHHPHCEMVRYENDSDTVF